MGESQEVDQVTIRVVYHFQLQDLWVQADVHGEVVKRICDGHRCWLEFPTDSTSFDTGDYPEYSPKRLTRMSPMRVPPTPRVIAAGTFPLSR